MHPEVREAFASHVEAVFNDMTNHGDEKVAFSDCPTESQNLILLRTPPIQYGWPRNFSDLPRDQWSVGFEESSLDGSENCGCKE